MNEFAAGSTSSFSKIKWSFFFCERAPSICQGKAFTHYFFIAAPCCHYGGVISKMRRALPANSITEPWLVQGWSLTYHQRQERPLFPVLAGHLISPACPCFYFRNKADCHPWFQRWTFLKNIHAALSSAKSIWPLLYLKLVPSPILRSTTSKHRSPPSCRCWVGGIGYHCLLPEKAL